MARKSAIGSPKPKRESWAVCGFDTSYSAIVGAAILYDHLLDKMKGPSLVSVRWNKGEQFEERMEKAARGHDIVHDLLAPIGIVKDIDNVFIAIESPFPLASSFLARMKSSYLLQQADIHGAFLGGLYRYGYRQIWPLVNVKEWRAVVAKDLGVKQNAEFTKFSVKAWALEAFDVPDLPDLIQTKNGKVPRPAGSRAKAVQPSDEYDALGILVWLQGHVEAQMGS